MSELVLLSGWALAAVVCWRWSSANERCETLRTTVAAEQSCVRALEAANAELQEVIKAIARRDAQVLSDRVFAMLPADDQADRWSAHEVQ